MSADFPSAFASRWLDRSSWLLIIFYAIAHGGLLLAPQSIYWDDWVLWNMDPAIVTDTFRQVGIPYVLGGLVHNVLLAAGPWFYKLLTFAMWLATGLMLHRIIKRAGYLDEQTVTLIILFYLTAPLFAGRITMILFPYTLYWSVFVLAWLMLGKNRWIALLLFALSFTVQSLLVFYALPMLELLVRSRAWTSPRSLAWWAISKIDLLLLPFVWFAIKRTYFKPTDYYVSYNENFAWKNLSAAARQQVADFGELSVGVGFFAFALAAVALACRWLRLPSETRMTPVGLAFLLAASLLALCVAVFPYWIIGKAPTFAEWGNRHQLLMPLGTAALLTTAILVTPAAVRLAATFSVLALFIAINWQNYADLLSDWQKQKALVAFLSQSKDVANANLVIFDDQTPNAFGRRIRFYEYTGMLKAAFGNESKFGVSLADYDDYTNGSLDIRFTAHYNAASHRRTANAAITKVKITVKGGTYRVSAGVP